MSSFFGPNIAEIARLQGWREIEGKRIQYDMAQYTPVRSGHLLSRNCVEMGFNYQIFQFGGELDRWYYSAFPIYTTPTLDIVPPPLKINFALRRIGGSYALEYRTSAPMVSTWTYSYLVERTKKKVVWCVCDFSNTFPVWRLRWVNRAAYAAYVKYCSAGQEGGNRAISSNVFAAAGGNPGIVHTLPAVNFFNGVDEIVKNREKQKKVGTPDNPVKISKNGRTTTGGGGADCDIGKGPPGVRFVEHSSELLHQTFIPVFQTLEIAFQLHTNAVYSRSTFDRYPYCLQNSGASQIVGDPLLCG